MIWYFAYGSNLDRKRFRDRVCDFTRARRAVLPDYALRFSGEVTSEGGGGAIVEPAPGERVYGGVYEISDEQLARMDEVELDSDMNRDHRGTRSTVTVEAEGAALRAELYEVPSPETYRAPSEEYLGHIVKGLRDFGYGDEVIERVRAIAASEPPD